MARSSDIAAPGPVSLPCLRDPAELNLVVVARQYLGSFRPGADEEAWRQATPIHCYSGEVSLDSRLPAPLISLDLRELWGRIDASLFTLAGRAKQIVQWDRDHQFCGRCARPLLSLDYDRAKRCPACDLTSYPRISPAIITAITRTVAGERQILLVRSPRFPPGMYSVVAGFVEPGESLEQCVEREVWEEVGLRVRRIRYFGSQPWPFPNSLMLGFTAEYAGGDLRLEEEEVADARWFSAHNLPKVPPPISIARQLIDNFVAQSDQDQSVQE